MPSIPTQARTKLLTVGTALDLIKDAYKHVQDIRKWRNGQISKRRCCQNIVGRMNKRLACIVGGGLAGGIAVAVALNPIVVLGAGFVGSLISAKIADHLNKHLLTRVFNLPQEISLENAYNFFRLRMNPSWNEVVDAAEEMHREIRRNGGMQEDILIADVQLAIIMHHWEIEGRIRI